MKNLNTKNLVTAAVCLALCMVLPQIGSALSPMHIPVLLAGFLCGPWWAMAVGAVAPLLRFALFHMPRIFPTGLAMCFELAAYGLVSGLLYRTLPKRPVNIYAALTGAMLAGRVVWGVVRVLLSRTLHLDHVHGGGVFERCPRNDCPHRPDPPAGDGPETGRLLRADGPPSRLIFSS